MAKALDNAIEGNARTHAASAMHRKSPNVFDSSEVPNISVGRYLRRLQSIFQCSDAALVGALVILDRFLAGSEQRGEEPSRVTPLNVHRLFLACLVVTVKYSEDLTYGNSHYAKAGGIQLREVNRLERHLLTALDYNLRVQPEEYQQYEEALRFGAGTSPLLCAGSPVLPKWKFNDEDGAACVAGVTTSMTQSFCSDRAMTVETPSRWSNEGLAEVAGGHVLRP